MPRQSLRHVLYTLALAVLLFGLAGCRAASARPTPTPTAEAVGVVMPAAQLIGSSWQAVAFGSPGESLPVDKATQLTLNFGVERYAGSGGCNWYLGVYSAQGDTIRFYAPATTLLNCIKPPNVMNQESTYFTAVQNILTYRKAGDNLLGYTSDNQLLLTFAPAQAVALEGTDWSLKFLLANQKAAPTIPGATITAAFAGGKLSGNAGCNSYTANYTLQNEALSISNLAVTEKACSDPQGVMEQEQQFLTNLTAATRLIQLGNILQLLNADGETVLAFGAP